MSKSKPWRVQRVGSVYNDFPSQRAAYESVGELTGLGFEVKVHHWETVTDATGYVSGHWRLYEHIEPATAALLSKRLSED